MLRARYKDSCVRPTESAGAGSSAECFKRFPYLLLNFLYFEFHFFNHTICFTHLLFIAGISDDMSKQPDASLLGKRAPAAAVCGVGAGEQWTGRRLPAWLCGLAVLGPGSVTDHSGSWSGTARGRCSPGGRLCGRANTLGAPSRAAWRRNARSGRDVHECFTATWWEIWGHPRALRGRR